MVNFGSYLLSKLFVLLDAPGGVYVEFLVLVGRYLAQLPPSRQRLVSYCVSCLTDLLVCGWRCQIDVFLLAGLAICSLPGGGPCADILWLLSHHTCMFDVQNVHVSTWIYKYTHQLFIFVSEEIKSRPRNHLHSMTSGWLQKFCFLRSNGLLNKKLCSVLIVDGAGVLSTCHVFHRGQKVPEDRQMPTNYMYNT